MIGLMVVMLMSYSCVVKVLLAVAPVLGSRYEVDSQNVCCIVSGN